MASVQEIMAQLQEYGDETTKKTLMRHGAREPFFGVRIGDQKKILKKMKKDHQLALDLYQTGNSDAMYLAGLFVEPKKMSKADLQTWVQKAYWHMLSECTVSWVAAEGDFGLELAREWIESDQESVAAAGWATLSSVVSLKPDEELDLKELEALLERVEKIIHQSENRVRYTMNGFVMAVGSYVTPLTEKALAVANKIGKVKVDMGKTACKVHLASEQIEKIKSMGRIGQKRKTVRC